MSIIIREIEEHLKHAIIPFWLKLRDDTYGGFYGLMTNDLVLHKEAEKGCILNSRILWFFSSAYTVLKDVKLLEAARHAYSFLLQHCLDEQYGGVYWSVTYDGKPFDTMKHTYNQAFAVYALSAYYEASKEEEAKNLALLLFQCIETKCKDKTGYLEAFDQRFQVIPNEALSENNVLAHRTMNTALHLLEAYTELYKITRDDRVKGSLCEILDTFANQIYSQKFARLDVFFDASYHTLIDLQSYGHDIEASWLLDRAVEVLDLQEYRTKISPVTVVLTDSVYKRGFDGHSVLNECENGIVNKHRIWWIQAESMVGFMNAYEKDAAKREYLEAVEHIWDFCKTYLFDKRLGSEWFWEVDENGIPYKEREIAGPWKCPYHNGRMCIELIRRGKQQ